MTRAAICAGLLFARRRLARRLARWRSTSSCGNVGFCATSASRSSARGNCAASDVTEICVWSIVEAVASGRAQPRSLVGDLQRVARLGAFVEHRGGEVRQAGRVRRDWRRCRSRRRGSPRPPATRCRSLRMTFSPLGSVNCSGVGNCAALTEPGLGMSLRHGSSALTLWAPPAGGSGRPADRPPASSRPGMANSTMRFVGCRCCSAKALTPGRGAAIALRCPVAGSRAFPGSARSCSGDRPCRRTRRASRAR